MPIINSLKTYAIQIGQSDIDTQNFQLSANNDGTGKLARKGDGTGGDILSWDAAGKVNTSVSQALLAPVKDALNATGTAPVYACRAWVNFNGTGTVAIRASGNVSSITDNAVGDYTVNFTTAMPDANYSLSGTASTALSGNYICGICPQGDIPNYEAGSIRFKIKEGSTAAPVDSAYISIAIFR